MARTLVTVFTAFLTCSLLVISHALASPPAPESAAASLDDLLTPRRTIPYSLLAVNAFANDQRFGSIRQQFREVSSTLGLRRLRVLFAWNDQVQPTRNSSPFFDFYDEIVNSLPPNTEAIAVLTGAPSWMKSPNNWIQGNPRTTFVELWVKKVAARYARRGRLAGFQIWNEPNNPSFAENETLNVLNDPSNYVELLASSHSAVKAVAPRKRVINAATTAIAQNFPQTLEYNRNMVAAGALSFTDAYAIHYYGKSAERVLVPGGVKNFLNQLNKEVWITETGAQGVNKQVEYAERMLPFLKSTVPSITRTYLYQFTEATPAESTYGLRNLTQGFTVSDLYINLRERNRTRRARLSRARY